MKAKIEELKKQSKDVLDKVYNLCHIMDEKNFGTQKWFPGKRSEEVLKLSLYTFFLYIAAADGRIAEEETGFINEMMDTSYSVQDYLLLSQKSKVDQDHFATEVPVPFRASVELDNQMGSKPDFSNLILKAFTMLGFGIILICCLLLLDAGFNEESPLIFLLESLSFI